ncbi:MAG TPA: DLW-39 family protein [Jatrophihabitantaceae bacterium]
MPKVLLLVVAIAGAAAVARKRASGHANTSLWRQATEDAAPSASRS